MAKLSSLPKVSAVVGILRRGDKILVCERPIDKPYAGFWEFPGGKIENNESSLNALKRELHEELGIRVNNATFLFQHHHLYPDKHVCLDLWEVTDCSGEPSSREKQILAWKTAAEIRQINLLTGNWAVLKRIAPVG